MGIIKIKVYISVTCILPLPGYQADHKPGGGRGVSVMCHVVVL